MLIYIYIYILSAFIWCLFLIFSYKSNDMFCGYLRSNMPLICELHIGKWWFVVIVLGGSLKELPSHSYVIIMIKHKVSRFISHDSLKSVQCYTVQ